VPLARPAALARPAPLARRPAALAALAVAALGLGGCGGDSADRGTPEDGVRDATSAYLAALEHGRWVRACGLMTRAARAEVAHAADSCAGALSSGVALPREELASASREVAGAPVRVRGATATIGPLGSLPQPLRLRRVDGRWLVAG